MSNPCWRRIDLKQARVMSPLLAELHLSRQTGVGQERSLMPASAAGLEYLRIRPTQLNYP